MAETDLVFNGTTLVDVVSASGKAFYRQRRSTPAVSRIRPISFYNTSYFIDRIFGFSNTPASAQSIEFTCTAHVASHAAISTLFNAMNGFQNNATIGGLSFATPIWNGAADSWTYGKLEAWRPMSPAYHYQPDGTWLAHFAVRFVRMGAG
jgi:hypothetical protein